MNDEGEGLSFLDLDYAADTQVTRSMPALHSFHNLVLSLTLLRRLLLCSSLFYEAW